MITGKLVRIQNRRCHAFFNIIVRETVINKAFLDFIACFMPMELPTVFLCFFPSLYLIYAFNNSFNNSECVVVII